MTGSQPFSVTLGNLNNSATSPAITSSTHMNGSGVEGTARSGISGYDTAASYEQSRRQVSSVVISEQLLGEVPDGGVEYREIPVVEEVVVHVPRRSVKEVEKLVPRQQIEWVNVERVVPQIVYNDIRVDKPEIQKKIIPRVVRSVQEVPVQVDIIKKIPQVVKVQQIEEIPQLIQVEQPYRVENPIYSTNYRDSQLPVVVAQTIRPTVRESGEVVDVEIYNYEPDVIPVDVHVAKPIHSKLLAVGATQRFHQLVTVPAAQYNTLLKQLNVHLGDSESRQLPFIAAEGGMVPFLDHYETPGTAAIDPAAQFVDPMQMQQMIYMQQQQQQQDQFHVHGHGGGQGGGHSHGGHSHHGGGGHSHGGHSHGGHSRRGGHRHSHSHGGHGGHGHGGRQHQHQHHQQQSEFNINVGGMGLYATGSPNMMMGGGGSGGVSMGGVNMMYGQQQQQQPQYGPNGMMINMPSSMQYGVNGMMMMPGQQQSQQYPNDMMSMQYPNDPMMQQQQQQYPNDMMSMQQQQQYPNDPMMMMQQQQQQYPNDMMMSPNHQQQQPQTPIQIQITGPNGVVQPMYGQQQQQQQPGMSLSYGAAGGNPMMMQQQQQPGGGAGAAAAAMTYSPQQMGNTTTVMPPGGGYQQSPRDMSGYYDYPASAQNPNGMYGPSGMTMMMPQQVQQQQQQGGMMMTTTGSTISHQARGDGMQPTDSSGLPPAYPPYHARELGGASERGGPTNSQSYMQDSGMMYPNQQQQQQGYAVQGIPIPSGATTPRGSKTAGSRSQIQSTTDAANLRKRRGCQC